MLMHVYAVMNVNHIKWLEWIYWTWVCGQPTRGSAPIPKLVV